MIFYDTAADVLRQRIFLVLFITQRAKVREGPVAAEAEVREHRRF